MKKVIFIVLLLAVASLGLALPPPTTSVANPPATLSIQDLEDTLKVSNSCATAIVKILGSPEFQKCIPVKAFGPILPIVTDPDFFKKLAKDPAGTFKKDEKIFVKFSTEFCPAPKCSDEGVQNAVELLGDGCKKDLENNPVIQLLFAATVFYSPLHDIVCFESTDSKLFCWDESAETILSLPKSPIKVTGDPLLDSIAVADCKTVCTNCNKSIINTFSNFIKGNDLALQVLQGLGVTSQVIDGLKLGVAVKCGINFEDEEVII